ncbi:hypothetical protein TNCV_3137381 [Trichonephila clavipes]|nr:hypothetical protein TNCV_3137381 [Trichonephila clavipes]
MPKGTAPNRYVSVQKQRIALGHSYAYLETDFFKVVTGTLTLQFGSPTNDFYNSGPLEKRLRSRRFISDAELTSLK